MNMRSIQGFPIKQAAARPLALIFALVFLLFQTSTLVHSHNGDLNLHPDCTLCFQLGSGHEAIPATAPSLVIPTLVHEYDTFFAAPVVVARVPANSRAPPLTA